MNRLEEFEFSFEIHSDAASEGGKSGAFKLTSNSSSLKDSSASFTASTASTSTSTSATATFTTSKRSPIIKPKKRCTKGKACVSCKNNKARCDGKTPCERCIKLDIGDFCTVEIQNLNSTEPIDRTLPSCINCKVSKVACDRKIPCQRCIKYNRQDQCHASTQEPRKNLRKRKELPLDVDLNLEKESETSYDPNYISEGKRDGGKAPKIKKKRSYKKRKDPNPEPHTLLKILKLPKRSESSEHSQRSETMTDEIKEIKEIEKMEPTDLRTQEFLINKDLNMFAAEFKKLGIACGIEISSVGIGVITRTSDGKFESSKKNYHKVVKNAIKLIKLQKELIESTTAALLKCNLKIKEMETEFTENIEIIATQLVEITRLRGNQTVDSVLNPLIINENEVFF